MRVYEVMSKAVETVKPAVHASEARNRMRQRKIHHLVVSEGARPQGIVSDRDLGGSKLPKLPKVLGTWTVADLMTSPVVTVTSRTPVRRAAALMKGRSIGSLVVTSANGKVAGIVTVSDLLELLARKPERHSTRDRRPARDMPDDQMDE
jgi:CBS domain-containing protein